MVHEVQDQPLSASSVHLVAIQHDSLVHGLHCKNLARTTQLHQMHASGIAASQRLDGLEVLQSQLLPTALCLQTSAHSQQYLRINPRTYTQFHSWAAFHEHKDDKKNKRGRLP